MMEERGEEVVAETGGEGKAQQWMTQLNQVKPIWFTEIGIPQNDPPVAYAIRERERERERMGVVASVVVIVKRERERERAGDKGRERVRMRAR